MKYLWEILVPTVRRKDGKPIRTRYHRVWDGKVRAIAGGLTILQPAKGQWVSPSGELFSERMIPVRVACSEEQIDKIGGNGNISGQIRYQFVGRGRAWIRHEAIIYDRNREI